MKYNPNVEYVIDNSTHLTVSPRRKRDLHQKLYSIMEEYLTQIDDRVRFDKGLEQMLVVSPILLNLIANRNPENVLFVGHYDQGKNRNWNRDQLNILSQLMPVIHKEYGFNFNMHVLKPNAPKNLGALWHLYDHFDLSTMRFNRQYLHGDSRVLIKDAKDVPDEKFDAIVFAGVPHTASFRGELLQSRWSRWCKPEYELIDIYEGDDSKQRFLDREYCKYISDDIAKAFILRSENDRQESDQKREWYRRVEQSVKVY